MGIPYFFLKDGTKVLTGTEEAEKVYRRLEQRLLAADPDSYKKAPPQVNESNVVGLLSRFEGHWQPTGIITNAEQAERVREFLCDGRSLFSYFTTLAEETKHSGEVPDEFFRHIEIHRNAAAIKKVASEARAWRSGKLLCDVLCWHLVGVVHGASCSEVQQGRSLPRLKGLLLQRSIHMALTLLQLDVPAYEQAGVNLLALKNALADIGDDLTNQVAFRLIGKEAGKLRRHFNSEDKRPSLAASIISTNEPKTLGAFFEQVEPAKQKEIIGSFKETRILPRLATCALKLLGFVLKSTSQERIGAGNFNLYILNALTRAGHTEDDLYLLERIITHLKDYDYIRHERPEGSWPTDGIYRLTDVGRERLRPTGILTDELISVKALAQALELSAQSLEDHPEWFTEKIFECDQFLNADGINRMAQDLGIGQVFTYRERSLEEPNAFITIHAPTEDGMDETAQCWNGNFPQAVPPAQIKRMIGLLRGWAEKVSGIGSRRQADDIANPGQIPRKRKRKRPPKKTKRNKKLISESLRNGILKTVISDIEDGKRPTAKDFGPTKTYKRYLAKLKGDVKDKRFKSDYAEKILQLLNRIR